MKSTPLLASLAVLALIAGQTHAALDVRLTSWSVPAERANGDIVGTLTLEANEPAILIISDQSCDGDAFNFLRVTLPEDGSSVKSKVDPLPTASAPQWVSSMVPLDAGRSSFQITARVTDFGSSKLNIQPMPTAIYSANHGFSVISGIPPSPDAIITHAAGAAICQSSGGMVLADVTTFNLAAAVTAITASNSAEAGHTNTVLIGSYNGDPYVGSALAVSVSSDGGATVSAVSSSAVRSVLCQPPPGDTPNNRVTVASIAAAASTTPTVVGPAGPAKKHCAACQIAGKTPAVLSGTRRSEFEAAAGALAQSIKPATWGKAWVGGWETRYSAGAATGQGLVLAVQETADRTSGVVVPNAAGDSLNYLCV